MLMDNSLCQLYGSFMMVFHAVGLEFTAVVEFNENISGFLVIIRVSDFHDTFSVIENHIKSGHP